MVYPHLYRTEHSETITTNSIYGDYYRKSQSKKIPIASDLLKILNFVDSNRNEVVKDLNEAIQIKSVSGKMEYRPEIFRMIKFVEGWLTRLNVKYECFNIGFHELDDGQKHRIPPVITGFMGKDSSKRTVCVYTNLDVLEPDESAWATNPWEVTVVDKKIVGNGVASGKGALIYWFYALLALQQTDQECPVNLKFCIESMQKCDSVGIEDFLSVRRHDFFNDIDVIVCCDGEWLGRKMPCLCYGTVGIMHFYMTIEKTEGSTTEIKDDMMKIFDKIRDKDNCVIIPKFHDLVQQITPDEEKLYEALDFNPEEIRDQLSERQKKWDKVNLLMHFWRLPSILVDDIEECICEKEDFSKIKRHFIFKIVPRQTVDATRNIVEKYVKHVVEELQIKNTVTLELTSSTRPWYENYLSPWYDAARRATLQIYKEDPNIIREDGDRKVLTILKRVTEKDTLLIPLGPRGLNAYESNENMPLRNVYECIKMLTAFLYQVAKVNVDR